MQLLAVIAALVPLVLGWNRDMEVPGLNEGDMVLTPEQLNPETIEPGTNTFAARKKQYMWPSKTIGYVIASGLRSKPKAMTAIRAAIADYHKYTCIRFVARRSQRAYFEFYNSGGGCFSSVGYHGDKNRISLSDGCWSKDTVIHEMGHSLGLYHEQSRPDRDNHVRIDLSPVRRDLQGNFQKQPYSNIDSRGSSYDYRSIMHYDQFAFGGGKKTIFTKDTRYQNLIGVGNTFSRQDVIQLNKMYGCPVNNVPLPPAPTFTCYDKSGACANSKESGHCTNPSWRTWIRANCHFSCGLCNTGGGGNTNCKDKNTNCPKWKHLCNNHDYVKKNCDKTCGRC